MSIPLPYFAYGSNLDAADLTAFAARVGLPAGRRHSFGAAWALGYRPIYHYRSVARGGGALDLIRAEGEATPGELFALDAEADALIARKEGERAGIYARFELFVADHGGAVRRAFSYRVTPAHVSEFVAPNDDYAGLVRRGLERLAMPKGAHDAAALGAHQPLPNRVFVYGTLRRGECRAGAMTERIAPVEVAPASTRGVLFDLGEYPALTLDADAGADDGVHGELFTYEDVRPLLPLLDRIEGFEGHGARHSLYERSVVPVQTSAGIAHAWVYFMRQRPDAPRIVSGDWVRHLDGGRP